MSPGYTLLATNSDLNLSAFSSQIPCLSKISEHCPSYVSSKQFIQRTVFHRIIKLSMPSGFPLSLVSTSVHIPILPLKFTFSTCK